MKIDGSSPPYCNERKIYWYLTFKCNLNCKHCWVNASQFNDIHDELSSEEIKMAINKINKLSPVKVLLTGGEPLARKDIVFIIKDLINRKINFALETNGTLITTKIATAILEGINMGIKIDVNVSIDGSTPEIHDKLRGTGSFRKTLNGIEILNKMKIPVDIHYVISRFNINDISNFFRVSSGFYIRRLKFGTVYPTGRAQQFDKILCLKPADYQKSLLIILHNTIKYKNLNIIIKLPPALVPPSILYKFALIKNVIFATSCDFPMIGILPDGALTVCALTRDRGGVKLGNIRHDSLLEISHKKKLSELRQSYLAGKLKGICSDCIFKYLCKGSCRAQSLEKFGTFNGAFPLCDEFANSGYFHSVYRISYRKNFRCYGQISCVKKLNCEAINDK